MAEIEIEDQHSSVLVRSGAGEAIVSKVKCRRVAQALSPGRGRLDEAYICAQLGLIEAAAVREEAGRKQLQELIKRSGAGKPVDPEDLVEARYAMAEGANMRALCMQAIEAWHAIEAAVERDARG